MTDLQEALGQFVFYKEIMQVVEPERKLYLAVPREALNTVFQTATGKLMMQTYLTHIIGYDIKSEEIFQWLP